MTAPTPGDRARQVVIDIVDAATTDRFVGIESVVEQQSVVINELRDAVMFLSGEVAAFSGTLAQAIAPTPQPKPKPAKGLIPSEGETT